MYFNIEIKKMSFHLPNDFKHRNDNSIIEKLQVLELK